MTAVSADGASQPRLLDVVRQAARVRHLSPRTEDAYVSWIWRFIVYHGKRHPTELNAEHVIAFLIHSPIRAVSLFPRTGRLPAPSSSCTGTCYTA